MSAPSLFHDSGVLFEPPELLGTAVLFLVFNRPDVTARVFEAIRRARPPRLYVAADGPRADRAGEAQRCEQTRAIVSQVDWPCRLVTRFVESNLGCKRAVSSAIGWFFEQEEEGIVLEDDCLPAPGFFWFCQALLRRYREDTRVWQVCGTAFLERELDRSRDASYFFSRYGPIWGWASWRRAWRHYDADLKAWPMMSTPHHLACAYPDPVERAARKALGERLYRNEIDTWDYQWGIAKNFHSGLSIVPGRSLIVNIGFGPEATHTLTEHPLAVTQSRDPRFPLTHPPFVLADEAHDALFRQRVIGPGQGALVRRMKALARRLLGKGQA